METEIQNEIASLQEALQYAQTDAEKQGLQETIDSLTIISNDKDTVEDLLKFKKNEEKRLNEEKNLSFKVDDIVLYVHSGVIIDKLGRLNAEVKDAKGNRYKPKITELKQATQEQINKFVEHAYAPQFWNTIPQYKPIEIKEPETKEVWQLTKKEFNSHPPKKVVYAGDIYKRTMKIKNGCRLYESKDFVECERNIHHDIVKEALSEGKPVPENVLADYPELTKKPEKIKSSHREPDFKEGDKAKVVKTGKIETIESIGAWDEEVNQYRILWSNGGVGYERELEVIDNSELSDKGENYEYWFNAYSKLEKDDLEDTYNKYYKEHVKNFGDAFGNERLKAIKAVMQKEGLLPANKSKKEQITDSLYKIGDSILFLSIKDGWVKGHVENIKYIPTDEFATTIGWYYLIPESGTMMLSEKNIKPIETQPIVKTFEYYKGIDFKYENQFQKNKAIEELISLKVKHSIISIQLMNRIEIFENNLISEETLFITEYTGMGGLDKFGAKGKGILYEFYTPDEIIKMMWALAYKYGHKPSSVLEPSVAIGKFFKYSKDEIKIGYEINLVTAIICKILYPNAIIYNNYFEQIFIKNNNSVKDKIYTMPKYDLVIGNPPYGDISGGGSKWLGMGEQKYSGATNYIDYFIYRGLDLLLPQGLLIYIVGAEKHNGGKLFLEKGMSNIKEAIAEKCELVDAYKLPAKLFQTTDVSSEIIILRKI